MSSCMRGQEAGHGSEGIQRGGGGGWVGGNQDFFFESTPVSFVKHAWI